MPFPENMVKVVFEFDWGTTGEIQDTGFWTVVTQEGTATFPDWAPTTDAIAQQAVEAWADNVDSGLFANKVIARRAIAYHYRQDHLEVLDRSEAAFSGDNAWAGSGSVAMPPQLSVVCSLYGYDPAGFVPQRARKRGRMYLPTPSTAYLNADGELSTGGRDTYRDVMQAFFNDFTDTLDIAGGSPLGEVHARPYISSVAGSIATKVGWIRVGSVIDTQRRRRNKLPEVYSETTINT